MKKQLHDYEPKDQVTLVRLDKAAALVDQDGEQVCMINASGAWIWERLGTQTPVAELDADAFIVRLEQLKLIVPTTKQKTAPALDATPCPTIKPEILGIAPLQVAANNSPTTADPFFEKGVW